MADFVATADFVCMRDGRSRSFFHAAVARLVGTERAAGTPFLPAAPPTGIGAVSAQKKVSG
jgi:hypothetical protein